MKPFPLSWFARGLAAAPTGRRILCTFTLVLLLQFALVPPFGVRAQSTQSGGRQQFDPLTTEEREQARRLTEDNARFKQLRGQGRQRLISVELATVKPGTEGGAAGRHAEVLYYRYDNNQGILTLVDLGRGAVREVTNVNGDAVPLSAEEVSEAIGLALQNQTLTRLLGPDYQRYRLAPESLRAGERNPVEALRVVGTSPRDSCYRRRCVSLLFRRGDTFLTGTSVIVDLTAQSVRVEQPRGARAPIRRRRR